eukprot:GHVS01046424.1.p1 GENE.GHVS01046424.1~~GHVS01046424.1.p1  ORF type:complete len:379 (-),score=44.16 GHVS01046424.1:221-1357(-)
MQDSNGCTPSPQSARKSITSIVGHRGFGASSVGACAEYPENSLASFQAAVDAGVDLVEIDVWLSRDGEVVVVHDEFIDGTVVYDRQRTIQHTGCEGIHDCRHCRNERTSIQCLDWWQYHLEQPEGLPLRRPWKLCVGDVTDGTAGEGLSSEMYYPEETYVCAMGRRHTVPTLKEVLERFHLLLKFNIELKGTNEKLGLKTLSICSGYSNSVVLRISSFSWIPPPCCSLGVCKCPDVNKEPNGLKQVDLLEPLVNNHLDIPIALLFNDGGRRLPSPARIVECLNKYNAIWAHVRYNCHFCDEHSTCDSEGEARDDEDHLREVVEHLRSEEKKVMTFWGQKGEDKEEDLCRSIRSGVSAICPNDPKLAMNVLEREGQPIS